MSTLPGPERRKEEGGFSLLDGEGGLGDGVAYGSLSSATLISTILTAPAAFPAAVAAYRLPKTAIRMPKTDAAIGEWLLRRHRIK